MNSIGNAINRILRKCPADISNDHTRLASPSDSAPPVPANLNYSSPPENFPKDHLSACSIADDNESKLIIPKFSRKFSTLRDLSFSQNASGKITKSFSEFRPVRPFPSPKFRPPCSPLQSQFMKPASQRLAEFSGKVVSNFSFTNCFFEANTNKVQFGVGPQKKTGWTGSGVLNGRLEGAWANLGFGDEAKKSEMEERTRSSGGIGKMGREPENAKALDWKKKNVQQMLSIKNNFSFRKIGPESGLNVETHSNGLETTCQLIRPKTKRIRKARNQKLDLLDGFIKQVLRQEKRAKRAQELEVVEHSSVFYRPGFFFHSENRILRRRGYRLKKGIFYKNMGGFLERVD